MDTFAILGDTSGPGELIGYGQQLVVRDRRGRFLVTHGGAANRLTVFDSSGRFAGVVGRGGAGPGEFRRVWRIFPYDSGVIVFDDRTRRLTDLDHDLRYRASRPFQAEIRSAVFASDRTGVVAAVIASPERIGFPMHRVDSGAVIIDSFGFDGRPFREDQITFHWKEITPGRTSDEIWVSNRLEYVFSRCRVGSASCDVFARPVDWFPRPGPDVLADQGRKRLAPPPELLGVWPSRTSTLVTLSRVADKEWRRGVTPINAGESAISDANRYWDTMVEFVHLGRSSVLASVRLDASAVSLLAPDLIWYSSMSDDGTVRVVVLRVTLTEPSTERSSR